MTNNTFNITLGRPKAFTKVFDFMRATLIKKKKNGSEQFHWTRELN